MCSTEFSGDRYCDDIMHSACSEPRSIFENNIRCPGVELCSHLSGLRAYNKIRGSATKYVTSIFHLFSNFPP